MLNAAGLHAPYALRLVLELVTDENIYGLGEVPGNTETEAALRAAREAIIGQDPFQLNRIQAAIAHHFGSAAEERGTAPWDQRRLVHLFSAIEVACYDIMGKVIGRSVADLLGGKVRDRVPFSAYLFYKHEGAGGARGFGTDPNAAGWAAARQSAALDADGIVAQAQAMCAEFGFQSIKLKGGAFPPNEEVAAIKALRAVFGPDVPLRLDPNAIWRVETAIRWGHELTGLLEYYEESGARPGGNGRSSPGRRHPASDQYVHHLLRRHSRQYPAQLRSNYLERSPLLGRTEGLTGTGPHLRHLWPRPLHAFQQPRRHLPDGNDSPGRRHPQPELCL